MDGELRFHVFREWSGYIWTVNAARTGDVIATSERYWFKGQAVEAMEAIQSKAKGSTVTDHTGEIDLTGGAPRDLRPYREPRTRAVMGT